jgi:hypothetical protein
MSKDSANSEQNALPQIDLSIFKEHIDQSFLDKLDSLLDIEKLIILAKPCLPQLNYITKFDKVKKRKVEKIEILGENISETFEKTPLIIYIIPPEIHYLRIIENHLSKAENKLKKQFHIIFIPQITNECLNFINSSIYKLYFKLDNFNLDMYYIDHDLLSLEDNYAFYNLYVKEDLNILSILAKCIIKFEAIFGKIKYKYYKGSLAKKLNQLLTNEEEALSLDNNDDSNNLETLGCIILDRRVDMTTPFCTNFVYEGLIDEFFGINLNSIKISSKILEKEKEEIMKIDLSENDKFYTNIKNYNFSKIRVYLPGRLQEHSKILEEGKKKMDDMKKIQENLEKVKLIKEERSSLTTHINIADHIAQKQKGPCANNYLIMEQKILAGDISNETFEFIDNELTKKSEEFNLLKILCLISSLKNGIKSKFYEQIKREFLQIYGFQELFLWNNLERTNIIKTQESSYYNDIEKKLKLIYEDVDLNEPNDISYAYSGYAPISIRLVEKAITKGWKSIEDVLYKIPGEYNYPKDESEIIKDDQNVKYFLLVFIGGMTYGELSAVRYLNKKFKNKKFVIITTGMINYKKIFNTMKRGRFDYIPDDNLNLNGDSNDNKHIFKNILTFEKVNDEINK